MKNINYKKLKQYDIGKMPTDPGYQVGQSAVTSGLNNTPGYDLSNSITQINRGIFNNTVAQVGTYAKNTYDILKAAPTASEISKAAVNAGIQATRNNAAALASGTAKMSLSGLNLADNIGGELKIIGGLTDVGETMNNAANAASKGLGAAGYVAGGIGTAMGLYNLANDISGFSDRLRGNDMLNMSSRQTASRYGVQYNRYGGLNSKQITDYTNAQNKASKFSMALNGLNTGISAGAMIAGIPGAIFGGLAGTAAGFLGGQFLGGNRSDDVEETKDNILAMQAGYNRQEESKAGSLGLQNQHSMGIADKGKNVDKFDPGKNAFNVSDAAKKLPDGYIHTEKGVEKGEVQGYAQPREGIVSMTDPFTHYLGSLDPFKIEKRVDNIPVGSNFDFGKDFILGNRHIFNDGKNPRYADLARIPLKLNEEINIKRQMGLNSPEDEQTYMKNWNFLRKLGTMQAMDSGNKSLRADKGKNINKFDGGTPGPFWSIASGFPYLIQNTIAANKETPYAQNSFVANPTGKEALDIQAAAKFDPSTLQDRARQLARQQMYNINNQGGLNGGQKLSFNMANNMNLMNQNSDILYKNQEARNAHNTAYAQALMNYGADEARRGQTALATQQEAYRQAVGAKQKWKAQALKDWYTIPRQGLQDWTTYGQYKNMLDLYNRQVNIDEKKLQNDIENANNNKNTSDRPIIIGDPKKPWEMPPISFDKLDEIIKQYLPKYFNKLIPKSQS